MNWTKSMAACATMACAAMACAADAHRFLYSDFMNRKIVYVDEANRDAYKEAFLPEVAFDLTRCGAEVNALEDFQGPETLADVACVNDSHTEA